ncbi:hypothetical protein ACQY0O_003424 [Thecaphora frezii]
MAPLRAAARPRLLYGTAWKHTLTPSLLTLALTSGFRGVDTAAQRKHYREDLIGATLATLLDAFPRHTLWLQSKFTPPSGQDWSGYVPYARSDGVEAMVLKSFASSLAALHPWLVPGAPLAEEQGRADPVNHTLRRQGEEALDVSKQWQDGQPYLDSYLLHSTLDSMEATVRAWNVLQGLYERGWVRMVGVSNFYDPQLLLPLLTHPTPPMILQNRYHHSTGHDVSLLPLLSPVLSPNLHPLPPSGEPPLGTIYQPFWTLTGNPTLLASPPVQALARKYNRTPQQIVYQFVAQGLGLRGLNTTVLCGSTREAHLLQAVEAVHDVDSTPWSEQELDDVRREVYGV